MSQNDGCHLQISAGYAVIPNFRITMSGVDIPGSYFGTWLKEHPHLKFMVTVAETKNKNIDRSIMLALVCFKTGFLFLILVVLKLNL